MGEKAADWGSKAVTGEAKTLPATQPVVSYKTDLDDEYLYLEVGEDA